MSSWGSEEQEYMDRPPRYVDAEGRTCYRASAMGLCVKALAAIGLGHEPAPPPAHMQKVFDQGHELEDEVLACTNAAPGASLGAMAAGERVRQVRLELPVKVGSTTVYVTCTLDELVEGAVWSHGKSPYRVVTETSYLVREAKAFGDDYWGKWKKAKGDGSDMTAAWAAFPGYALQVSIQMFAMQHEYGEMPALEFLVGLKNKNRDKIVGWDSTFITEPPVDLKVVKLKLMKVEAIIKSGELPETCDATYPCPVYYLHGDAQKAKGSGKGKGKGKGKGAKELPELDTVEDDLFDSLCAQFHVADTEYKVLMEQVAKVDEVRKAARLGIQGFLDAKGKKGEGLKTARYMVVEKVEDRPQGIIKAHQRRTTTVERIDATVVSLAARRQEKNKEEE